MECESGNDYLGDYFGLRIASVFVLFAASAAGAFLPLIFSISKFRVPPWVFFILRYVGSGVIVAAAFCHLLTEGQEALATECLGEPFTIYPFSSGIALMGVHAMFLFDIIAHRHIQNKHNKAFQAEVEGVEYTKDIEDKSVENIKDVQVKQTEVSHASHLQILNSFVLEFGIVFHSVFVGFSLAVAGEEFIALFVAILFHQMFEGLGLGTRFAVTKWPDTKKYMPWLLALAYSLTTPIAIAIGLGVRHSYPPGSRTGLIVTGVFDSLCGGVLIYNGLVELLAYDFLYSSELLGASNQRVMWAYVCVCFGAFVMALIGRWA